MRRSCEKFLLRYDSPRRHRQKAGPATILVAILLSPDSLCYCFFAIPPFVALCLFFVLDHVSILFFSRNYYCERHLFENSPPSPTYACLVEKISKITALLDAFKSLLASCFVKEERHRPPELGVSACGVALLTGHELGLQKLGLVATDLNLANNPTKSNFTLTLRSEK